VKFAERLGVAWQILTDRRYLHVPRGHPYSPLPSPDDLDRVEADPGGATVSDDAFPGIDLRLDRQWSLVDELMSSFPDMVAWIASDDPVRYRYDNTWFTGSDALLCALVVARLTPARIVEVGCGYSSALLLDVIDRTGAPCDVTFIDPDPQRLRSLVAASDLAGRLESKPVQDVDASVFGDLCAGDVLCIDSSHVMRAGSDVHHLLLEVIPTLASGVWIHVHDVFAAFSYPRRWLRSGVAVNEAYALRALLVGNAGLEVALWNAALEIDDPQRWAGVVAGLPPSPVETGGMWVRTTGGAVGH
jgi:SAM-dependent methyltransferase